MHMKKSILLLLLAIFAVQIQAQITVAPHQDIVKFLKSTTCVVLDDDIFNTYNSKIEEAVKNHWKITPFKFITMTEFDQMKKDTAYSFLMRTRMVYDKDEKVVDYSFLSLVLGGKAKKFAEMPDLCSFPLSYYNVDYDKYDYKLGAVVNFMQNHVKLTFDNPNLSSKNIIQYYNKNVTNIKGKTLYVIKEELAGEVNTVENISKYYKGNVKIVSAEDIQEAINKNDENVVFLHKVGPPADSDKKARCYKLVMGASDAKLYYFDFHMIKNKNVDGFLVSDFKNLQKDIK